MKKKNQPKKQCLIGYLEAWKSNVGNRDNIFHF